MKVREDLKKGGKLNTEDKDSKKYQENRSDIKELFFTPVYHLFCSLIESAAMHKR
ncbi:MAG: hypothetical protein HXS54_14230 [Theionarchaea archaeon]|nr:hypothetical protein [Theionarchaea archaeon]